MGNFAKQQEEKTKSQEREKTRREKLAGYFFDLSKLIFAGLVIGGISPLFADSISAINWITEVLGGISAFLFAFFASRMLKIDNYGFFGIYFSNDHYRRSCFGCLVLY